MKIKQPTMGAEVIGKIPSLAVTKYVRNGVVVTRKSYSEGRRSNSRKQFIQRQRMRHSIALWKKLTLCSPMFTQGKTAYLNFLSLANQLPVVYVPKFGPLIAGSLLMPGIPVSDGNLTPMLQQLGEVGGTPALITNLKADTIRPNQALLLYTAEQQLERFDYPNVGFSVREVKMSEFVEVDGCLALVDNDFANEMKGWALVRVRGRYCSSQAIVTRCNYYKQFTTEEALKKAVQSYGGLK